MSEVDSVAADDTVDDSADELNAVDTVAADVTVDDSA